MIKRSRKLLPTPAGPVMNALVPPTTVSDTACCPEFKELRVMSVCCCGSGGGASARAPGEEKEEEAAEEEEDELSI